MSHTKWHFSKTLRIQMDYVIVIWNLVALNCILILVRIQLIAYHSAFIYRTVVCYVDDADFSTYLTLSQCIYTFLYQQFHMYAYKYLTWQFLDARYVLQCAMRTRRNALSTIRLFAPSWHIFSLLSMCKVNRLNGNKHGRWLSNK